MMRKSRPDVIFSRRSIRGSLLVRGCRQRFLDRRAGNFPPIRFRQGFHVFNKQRRDGFRLEVTSNLRPATLTGIVVAVASFKASTTSAATCAFQPFVYNRLPVPTPRFTGFAFRQFIDVLNQPAVALTELPTPTSPMRVRSAGLSFRFSRQYTGGCSTGNNQIRFALFRLMVRRSRFRSTYWSLMLNPAGGTILNRGTGIPDKNWRCKA